MSLKRTELSLNLWQMNAIMSIHARLGYCVSNGRMFLVTEGGFASNNRN